MTAMTVIKMSENGVVDENRATTIADDDVYWTMTWGDKWPDKPRTEEVFEDDKALARLLGEGVIFLNSHWWEKEWPEDARKKTSLNVNCNDIFAWGSADAESIDHDDIKSLYDHWIKDRSWGAAKWCAIRRNQKPQPPIIAMMKKAGAWDQDMEELSPNYQDAIVKATISDLLG